MFCYHKTSASNNEKFFRKGIFLSITLLIATTVLTSCKGGTSVNSEIRSSEFNNNEVVYPSNPAFGNNVTAHDPSIFKDDDGTYYTFGSHFAVTKSINLMQ